MSALASFLQGLETDRRVKLAKAAGTSPAMLDQYAGDHKRPGPVMSRNLVTAATKLGLQLTLNDCRPDIWAKDEAA